MIVQIYEIQTVQEARALVDLGVDHIGSVIQREKDWNDPKIKAVVEMIQKGASKSSLIPLFNRPEAVCRVLGYHLPDIVHFCEDLLECDLNEINRLFGLQEQVRKAFPRIAIMRTIPIPLSGQSAGENALSFARRFEPISDYFLIDTHITDSPVEGFAGITGKLCDWALAAALVRQSGIPVILAGGLGPDNVMEAIRSVKPAGVDSCTGTNARDTSGVPVRFRKDMARVKIFVAKARQEQKGLYGITKVEKTA